jgi:hypothetical protein
MVFQTPNLERIERACRDRDRKYHVCQFCLEIVDFELEYNEFTWFVRARWFKSVMKTMLVWSTFTESLKKIERAC